MQLGFRDNCLKAAMLSGKFAAGDQHLPTLSLCSLTYRKLLIVASSQLNGG
jgi:hypothetical protein